MSSPRRARLVSGLVLTFGLSSVALAQSYHWQVSPYMTLIEPREWKMSIRLQVDNFEDERIRPEIYQYPVKRMDTTGGSVFFPVVPTTSFSQTSLNHIKSSLSLNDRVVDDEAKIFVDRGDKPLPAGTFLAELTFDEYQNVQEMTMTLTITGRSWEVLFDEKRAAEVGWPKELPPVLQGLFEPEMFIDRGPYGPYSLSEIKKQVLEWTEGNPKALPPVKTAKWLAFKVAEWYNPSGRGFGGPVGESSDYQPVTAFGAFNVDGPEYALKMKRGSKYNMSALLVACYRAAGIPARLVIGYDFSEKQAQAETIGDRLHCWVEFALYDENEPDEARRLTWVPVDVEKLRLAGAATQPFERPIKYFGQSDEWDELIPLAFHFTPYWAPGVSYGRYNFEADETRRYYGDRYGLERNQAAFAPALWSWNVLPGAPRWAGQWLDFTKDAPMNTELDPLPPEAKRGAPRRN